MILDFKTRNKRHFILDVRELDGDHADTMGAILRGLDALTKTPLARWGADDLEDWIIILNKAAKKAIRNDTRKDLALKIKDAMLEYKNRV